MVDGGELENELHRQGTLVALDEVQVGRRDAEALRHCRLRQLAGRADAANARSSEDFLLGHERSLTLIYKLPLSNGRFLVFTIFTNLQGNEVKHKTGFPEFSIENVGFSRLSRTAM
jgi:hypothetical protein